MKILALIPARAGSKRLPGKNTRLLDGKPLIEWTINLAKMVTEISDVLVSTDDLKIAHIARSAGAKVPWMRPAELATDTATSADVALHALDYYEKKFGQIDGLLLLQPTSPFRSKETIVRGIKQFVQFKKRRVISVSESKINLKWCFKIDGELLKPLNKVDYNCLQHDDACKVYIPNGCFYLVTPEVLRKDLSFYGNDMVPLVIDNIQEAIDIDTELDWQWAEFHLGLNQLKFNGAL